MCGHMEAGIKQRGKDYASIAGGQECFPKEVHKDKIDGTNLSG